MRHTGPAPFGFEWNGGKLRLVEKETSIRQLAFELYLELRNKRAVARKLNELGHTTRKGSQSRDVTVSRLLVCSSARGLYVVNKTTVDSDGKRIEKLRDEWSFIECPRIVSEELWAKVESALSEETAPASAANFLFTGVLYCCCGARMNATSSSPKYACAQCGNRIPMTDLENALLDEITSFLRTRKRSAVEILSSDPNFANARELFQRKQSEVARIDEDIWKSERLYMENRISLERFEKIHRPLEDQRRAVQRELGKIKAKLSRLEAKQAKTDSNHPFDPLTVKNEWPRFSSKARRDIVRAFVDRIIVAEDEIEFCYPFRDSSERTAKPQQSSLPTRSSLKGDAEVDESLYIRLPKPGQRCPRTGMTRSGLKRIDPSDREKGVSTACGKQVLAKTRRRKGRRESQSKLLVTFPSALSLQNSRDSRAFVEIFLQCEPS